MCGVRILHDNGRFGQVHLVALEPLTDVLFSEKDRISLALCDRNTADQNSASPGPTTWVYKHGGGVFRSGTKTDNDYTVLFDLRCCQNRPRPVCRCNRRSHAPELVDVDW